MIVLTIDVTAEEAVQRDTCAKAQPDGGTRFRSLLSWGACKPPTDRVKATWKYQRKQRYSHGEYIVVGLEACSEELYFFKGSSRNTGALHEHENLAGT